LAISEVAGMNPLFPLAAYSDPVRLRPPERAGDWATVLEPGERLLWTGRPATGFQVRIRHLGPSIIGLIFTPFALWLSVAALFQMPEDTGDRAVLIGIILFFLVAGGWLIAGMHVLDMLRRRGMHYALTDRRALTDVDLLGRVTYAVEIGPDSPVWLARTTPGSAFFGQLRPPPGLFGSFGGPRRRSGMKLLGFELIEDAAKVYELLQQVQADAQARWAEQEDALEGDAAREDGESYAQPDPQPDDPPRAQAPGDRFDPPSGPRS